jgi:hypothetical protein
MCAQKLWRLVKPWTAPLSERSESNVPALSERSESNGRLTDWAATIFTENGDSLVIAMEVQTYLTLVFPYGEGEVFEDGFVAGLVSALHDLGVADHFVADELVAAAGPLCLSRLTDPKLRVALKTAQFTCGIERAYHDDRRVVQRNLNDLPHDLPPDHVPAIAVRRLFSGQPA